MKLKISQLKNISVCGPKSFDYACEKLVEDFSLVGGEVTIGGKPFQKGSITVGCMEDESFKYEYYMAGLPYPVGEEQYFVAILCDRIVIGGSDERGTIYGIYRLAQELGIPAGKRFIDFDAAKCEELEVDLLRSKKPTYKYRGWFINDEDLLTNWRIKYSRELDYSFYSNIISLDALDMIVETALRMNINTIIPATLLDIDDIHQEELVSFCAERGMMVSQHHLEPLGVSHWYYNDYMQKQGKDTTFSFVTHKEGAIEAWKHYAAKWAKYKEHVIWQLGLRGKADRPVWENDNAEKGMKEWGDIISEAYQTQYDIVKELCGDDFASTATLWMEGATLYINGYLHIPQKTTVVFSDVGPTQMLSGDFYEARREADHTYGIYYHTCYWGDGPHHTQGVSWKKMEYNYREAIARGDCEYSMLNVSNVRPFILSLEANAHITNDIDTFDAKKDYYALAEKYFGNREAGKVLEDYFDAFVSVPTEKLVKKYEKFFSFKHGEYNDFQYYAATDGFIKWLGREGIDGVAEDYWCDYLNESIEKFKKVLSLAEALNCNKYFDAMLQQIKHMIYFESWAYNCCKYGETRDKKYLVTAIPYLNNILEMRKALEKGVFANWYKGDKKIGIAYLIKETEMTVTDGKRTELII